MTPIVCFGDSITEGAEFPVEARWTSQLQKSLDRWRPGHFQIINRGVGGNTTSQGFDRLSSDVLPFLPAVLLLQFGFNDSNVYGGTAFPRVSVEEYVRNMREFHRLAIAEGGRCIFILNHAIVQIDGKQGNGRSYNFNFENYDRALRFLVRELDASAVDLPAMMKAGLVDVEEFVAEDGLHLSEKGNFRYGQLITEALFGILADASESGEEKTFHPALSPDGSKSNLKQEEEESLS